MRFVVVGVLGLLVAASAFAGNDNNDVARAKKILAQINGVAENGLADAGRYKYKIAGLCKFVGQLIPVSERAEKLSSNLQNSNPSLSETLMKARAILFVAEVDICTAGHTYGQPQGYDQKTESKDADTLEQNLKDLVQVTAN